MGWIGAVFATALNQPETMLGVKVARCVIWSARKGCVVVVVVVVLLLLCCCCAVVLLCCCAVLVCCSDVPRVLIVELFCGEIALTLVNQRKSSAADGCFSPVQQQHD